MDSFDENKNFFRFVFNFDDESKAEIFNVLQYVIVAIIPIVILNKTLQKYIPEADEKKSSMELSFEIFIQVIALFLGLFFINRMVIFVPTYSGVKYPDIHIIYFAMAILTITLGLQTKLGEKVSILCERIYDMWHGTSSDSKKKKKTSASASTTAITQQPIIQQSPTTMPSDQMVNYNNMYRQDTTPLVGANDIGAGMEGFEPMPANAALGGNSAFAANW